MAGESPFARPEILAPVGNADMLRAAVFAGADAVYLGLHDFNARRTAGNFGEEELCAAAAFCRARGVRVYVTLNTTLYPGELAALEQAVRAVARAGADAVIVQDMAAAALVRRCAPGLALHGSTQMSVQSAAGARQLAALGFSRVILARELTLREIAAITASCGIETEVFVHGALCMSVSGQCYMSAFLGGRSGNRGGCAGPCRLPFDASGAPGPARGCHLSLKDMSVVGQLRPLAQAGVASVKIEGRLRPPEYVAAAVDACVHARAGEPYDEKLLQDVFSRSGFTDGYLTGRRDSAMFGVRTGEDTAAARAAAPRLRELYRRERPRVAVDMALDVSGQCARLTVRDGEGHTAAADAAVAAQPARSAPAEMAEAYGRALAKTGGTPFLAGETKVTGTEWFVPAGTVAQMRRTALEALLEARSAPRPLPFAPWAESAQAGGGACEDLLRDAALPGGASCALPRQRAAGGPKALAARFACVSQLGGLPEALLGRLSALAVPVEAWREVPGALREKTWLELPRALFGGAEAAAQAAVEESRGGGFAGYVAENIAHFTLAAGAPVRGGFGLNVTNPAAAGVYAALGARALTLSPELTAADMARCGAPVPTAALAYGHMPLMLTRACPLHNVHGCAGCAQRGELLDRKGMRFPVRCSGPAGGRTVYNPIPIYMGDRQDELPVDGLVLYFTLEEADAVRSVMEAFCAGRPFAGAFTRGLYYKGTS